MTSHTTLARSTVPFMNIEEQVVASPKTRATKLKPRKISIPRAAPELLKAMLRDAAAKLDDGTVPAELDAQVRQQVGNAWVALNQHEPIYKALHVWADAVAEPPLLVHPDFCPETVRQASFRILGKFAQEYSQEYPGKLNEALAEFVHAGLSLSDTDVADLF
jgi:hypothetical protein